MELNYHHLFLFWTVAKEGSVIQASRTLGLSQPTLSAQIRSLEIFLGKPLFARKGKNQTLTETGHIVFEYANEIFALGKNLVDTVHGLPGNPTSKVRLGVSDTLPKLISCKLIDHTLRQIPGVKVEGEILKAGELQARLEANELDVALTDTPLVLKKVRPRNHLLLESDLMLFGTADLVSRWGSNWPTSLHQAPFLMPGSHFQIRQALEAWLTTHNLTPSVVGEYNDSAMIEMLGSMGCGIFVSPGVIARDVVSMYQVAYLHRLEGYVSQVYAVTVEKRPQHAEFLASLQQAATGWIHQVSP